MNLFQKIIRKVRIINPDNQVITDMFTGMIVSSLLGLILMAIVVVVEQRIGLTFIALGIVANLVVYISLRQGRLDIAKQIAVFGTIMLIVLTALQSYGIYSPIIIALVIPIMLSAFLYSTKMTILTCACVSLSGAVLVILAQQNIIATPNSVILPIWLMWALLTSIFVMVTIICYFARYGIDQLITRTEHNLSLLEQRNQQLDQEIQNRIEIYTELARSEERYRTIVEDQPNFIVRWALDGTIEFANQNYCDDLRRPYEEVIGLNFLNWASEETKAEILNKIYALTPEQPVKISTHKATNWDGEIIWHQWSDRVVFDEEGQPIAVESIGTNVTSEKLLEENRTQLEIAEQREIFLQEFFSMMTHDLKTPLSIMNTSLYLAGKTADAEKRAQHFDKIQRQIKWQEQMINNILEVLRLNHQPSHQRELLAINSQIQQVYDSLQSKALAKSITLDRDLSADLPQVFGDLQQIQRLLLNLVENALNYTPNGGIIRIKTSHRADDIIIIVSDTGIGIPEDDLEHIFDQFYRAQNTKNIEGGTGLGLAIVKRIVELHQGTIQIESEIHQSTTVTITLPITRS